MMEAESRIMKAFVKISVMTVLEERQTEDKAVMRQTGETASKMNTG